MTTVRITPGELSNHRNGLSDLAIRHAIQPNQRCYPFGLTRSLVEIAGKWANLEDMTTSGSVKVRIHEDLIFALPTCASTYNLTAPERVVWFHGMQS